MLHNLYLDASIKIAKEAGLFLKENFEKTHHVSSKSHINDLVTECDLASEMMIKSFLKKAFPQTSFFCEESKIEGDLNKDCWIIDPLDGTVNFANKIPFFCVSIAFCHKNEIQIGVIYSPMTQELFYAIKDKGAFLNEKKIQVSSKNEIMKAFGATGFPYLVQKNVKKSLNPIEHMLKKGIPLRRLGSACLDLAYTAASRFDLFFESYLEPWDFAAGSLLVKEAGGTITDFENKIIPIFQASSIAASNGHLHKSLMKELQG